MEFMRVLLHNLRGGGELIRVGEGDLLKERTFQGGLLQREVNRERVDCE